MRILFDENVPRDLKDFFTGFAVVTVQEMGWGTYKNGALIALADGKFDVFLTIDKNMAYQNKLDGRAIIHVTMASRFVRIPDLVKLVPEVIRRIRAASPGEVMVISGDTNT